MTIRKLTKADQNLIRMSVGNIHCCTPDAEMLETMHKKLGVHNAEMTPACLRAFDSLCVRTHRANRGVFEYVMGGMKKGC